jgi:Na+-translocating ferredoxin:NAD+ oxidoreductase RnfA subunit
MSLWVLEPGVVLADSLLIKLLVCVPFLQSGSFAGVTWRRALVASLLGNIASFFVGVLASGAPWIVREAGVLE